MELRRPYEDQADNVAQIPRGVSRFKLEHYNRPPPGYYYPPSESGRRFGIFWPTGFAGGGWLVRDASGEVVYAHAFRADCLAWIATQDDEGRLELLRTFDERGTE